MVTCMAPPRRLAKREYCGDQFKKTLDLASTHSPLVETKGRKELRALSNGDSSQKNTLLQTIENVDFSNKNSRQLTVQDQPKWQLYIFTGTQHREKFKELNGVYNTMSSKEEEKTMRSMKNTSSVFHRSMSKDIWVILFYWFIIITTIMCSYGHLHECPLKWKIHDSHGRLGSSEDTFTRFYVYDLKEIHHYDDYECRLKWKIHDTLSRLGSSEDTFTQVYVYDLKEIHHYDNRNTFWIDKRQQKNRISHYVKPPYDSFNDEYQKSNSGTRRSLGS